MLNNRLWRAIHKYTDIHYQDYWWRKVKRWFTVRRDIVRVRGIKRGVWWDTDTILFHAMFSLLCDFVENEYGYMDSRKFKEIKALLKEYDRYLEDGKWTREEFEKDYVDAHYDELEYVRTSWLDRLIRRSYWKEKLGLAHLDWAINLVNDPNTLEETGVPAEEWHRHQSEMAQKIKELYPNRPEPYAGDGPKHFFVDEHGNGTVSPLSNEPAVDGLRVMRKFSPEARVYFDQCRAIEEQYEQEDTEKMIELIKLRRALWT